MRVIGIIYRDNIGIIYTLGLGSKLLKASIGDHVGESYRGYQVGCEEFKAT